MLDKKIFFDSIRPHINLTTQNVVGFEKILDYGEKRQTPLNQFAYVLPTSFWESGQTMHPVKEAFWLSEEWRRNNLRYYPWYGRGLVQTTWERNYAVLTERIRVDFLTDPDLLLEWEYALPALFIGMEEGLYTGKSLDDYIDDLDEPDDEDLREFVNARRIVNGTDRQFEIGRLALVFEHGLRAAGYAVPEDDKQKLSELWRLTCKDGNLTFAPILRQ